MALEYAVHQLAGYHLLARSFPGDHVTIRDLWDRVTEDREQGRIASSEPGVGGVGVTLTTSDGTAYFGGVPAAEDDDVEGYGAVEVPGGSYAMVTYSGSPEHISQVFEALRESVADSVDAATGESIEVYRTGEDGELMTDLGLRLADA